MARYRFILRPKWILSHLFVLVMVVAFINLGFWQLSRLQEKRDRNDRVVARTAQPAHDVTDLGEPNAYTYEGASSLEFRTATATGTYLADQEVLVRSRSRNGAPGSWVLTPLLVDDRPDSDLAVVVNRGWIPNSGALQAVPDEFRAPSGEVTVTGLVRTTETKGRIGSTDPDSGTITDFSRADIARLDQQVDEDLLPFYLQLREQTPPVTSADPAPVPAPELDEGPHLSYALQWFTFALMTVIIYPLILRRRAKEIEREAAKERLDQPDPSDVPDLGDPRLEVDRSPIAGDPPT